MELESKLENIGSKNLTEVLESNLGDANSLKTYTCNVKYSNTTGRVKEVAFN